MAELGQVIMEQAMRFGRTITIRPADAIVNAPAGVAAPQFIEITLTNQENQSDMNIAPTHTAGGCLMGEEDWIGFIRTSAANLDKREDSARLL